MRSTLFNLAFKGFSLVMLLAAFPLTLLPSRRPAAWMLRIWARGILWLMRAIAGIRVEIRGREHLPKDRPVVIAGKHQSECDGIVMMALVPDLAAVAMRELARLPVAGPLLRKLQMILVDTEGGGRQRATLIEGARAVHAQGRSILIYPEGTLMAVGTKERYRAGVWHVAHELGVPVVPVATNVGLCWDRRKPRKKPGRTVVEFLPAIEAGPDKAAFMARLEAVIEPRWAELAVEGRAANGGRPRASTAPTARRVWPRRVALPARTVAKRPLGLTRPPLSLTPYLSARRPRA